MKRDERAAKKHSDADSPAILCFDAAGAVKSETRPQGTEEGGKIRFLGGFG